jgi:hypothetical protein
VGLSVNHRLTPLFYTPVELLANCKQFLWVGNSVLGVGELVNFDNSRTWDLPFQQAQAIRAECMLRLFASLKEAGTHKHQVRRYYRNLENLRFMRATWDALCLGYQAVRRRLLKKSKGGVVSMLNSADIRAVNRFKVGIVRNPEDAAMRLKRLASDLRGWYFDRTKPCDHLGRPIHQKWAALAFSYVARSLPAPMGRTGDGIVDLVTRLTSEPVPRVKDWGKFVKKMFKRLSRRTQGPANLRTAPSGHAALGYPRQRGGHVAAVTDLTCLGYFLMQGLVPWDDAMSDAKYANLFKGSMFDVTRFHFVHDNVVDTPVEELEALHRFEGSRPEKFASLLRSSEAGDKHQAALMAGCMWVMDQIDHVPVLPIEAGEKGMKTRFPTCSLTACNLMQQMLRRVIDHLLIKDVRMEECFGGSSPGKFESSSDYYSQDMSFATDLHPHWLTREVYEQLVPFDLRLEIFLPYFDKIFGPKRLVLSTLPSPVCDLSKVEHFLSPDYRGEPVFTEAPLLPPALRAVDPDWVLSRLTVRGRVPRNLLHSAMVFLAEYRDWVRSLSSPAVGPLTTVGAMMGDPTSFPVMPIMSAYAAFKAKHSSSDGKLTGDDAAFSGFGRYKVTVYEDAMASLGGVISPKKTEWHKKKALFCEVPFFEGRRQPFTFLSNWVAPPGGSKGEINWHNQSLTVVQQNSTQGLPATEGLWEYSPMWRMQQAAFLLGLPLGAPPGFGGAAHPKFPKTSVRHHGQWIGYLSTMSQAQMISGAGLTLMPSPYQELRLKAADFVVNRGLERKQEISDHLLLLVRVAGMGLDPNEFGPPPTPIFTEQPFSAAGKLLPSLEEACDAAAAPLISASLYSRGPINISHAPSILRMSRVFQMKIRKSPPKYFRFVDVKREVERRTQLYVTRAYRAPSSRKISYGLMPAAELQRYRLDRWSSGRVEFR